MTTPPGSTEAITALLFGCLPMVAVIAALIYALVLLTRISQNIESIRRRIDAAGGPVDQP